MSSVNLMQGAGSVEATDWSGRSLFAEDLEKLRAPGLIARRTDWSLANLELADLSGMDGRKSTMYGTHLERACLDRANLARASFSYCDAEEASFHSASFRGCRFEFCNLARCDLRNVDWRFCRVDRCDLRGSRLEGGRNIWGVHSVIAEILRRAARGRPERLEVAAFVETGKWCWRDWLGSGHSQTAWGVEVLGGWVRSGDHLPAEFVARIGGRLVVG